MSSAVNQSSSAKQQSQHPSEGHHHHHHHHKHHAGDDAPATERFGKLRHSPREKVGAKVEQVAPVEHEHHHHRHHHHHQQQQEHGHHHHHRHPNAFPSAESFNLSPDQEAFLKDASYARGGSLANHLRADYDLHRRCSLPPMQARFEACLIYIPQMNDGLTRGGGEAKAPVGVSITAASGQQAQLQHQPAHDQHSLQPPLSPYHHPNEKFYYSAASTAVSNDEERRKEYHHQHLHAPHDAPGAPSPFFYHTDFYNLGADYDIHKSCLLPSGEAKFGESFIHMPDWEMTRQVLKELRDQYPHLHL